MGQINVSLLVRAILDKKKYILGSLYISSLASGYMSNSP